MAETPKTEYTPRERVVAAYKGGFADRVPAYPIAGTFAGCLDGLSIEEYCTNPTKAAKAMLNYYERYEPDIMIAFNDLAKEAPLRTEGIRTSRRSCSPKARPSIPSTG